MSNFLTERETDLVDIIDYKIPEDVRKRFADIKITNDEADLDEATFPTIFIRTISAVEKGQDLEGKSINGALWSLQIDVTSKEKKVSSDIIDLVITILKQSSFEVYSFPLYTYQNGVCRYVARVRRVIGNGELL